MAFIGATKYEGTAAVSSFTIPWASTAAGQVCLLAVVIGTGTGASITTPTGFVVVQTALSFNGMTRMIFRRVTDGSESGTVTVTVSSATAAAVMLAYSEIDTAAPVNGAGAVNNSSGTAVTVLTGSPATPAALLQVSFVCTIQSTTSAEVFFGPTNMTTRATALSSGVTPFVSLWSASADWVQPGATFGNSVTLGTTASWLSDRINLSHAAPTAFAEAPGTAAAPSWANETAAAPLTARSSLTGLSAIPTTGQLWPRGSTSTRG